MPACETNTTCIALCGWPTFSQFSKYCMFYYYNAFFKKNSEFLRVSTVFKPPFSIASHFFTFYPIFSLFLYPGMLTLFLFSYLLDNDRSKVETSLLTITFYCKLFEETQLSFIAYILNHTLFKGKGIDLQSSGFNLIFKTHPCWKPGFINPRLA